MSPEASDFQLKYFNVLSIDFGLEGGLFSCSILHRLQEEYPKFLRDADLLVGSGFGAAQVASLACEEPLIAYPSRGLRRKLERQFGDLRLGELSKKVAIPAVIQEGNAWRLKVFHNFVGADSDAEELVVEVILKSLETSPYFEVSGYSPGMVALAQALDLRTGTRTVDDLSLLSIGDAVTGGTATSHFQCKSLLLSGYRRISAEVEDKLPSSTALKKSAEDYNLEPIIKWLKEQWL